MSPSFLHRCLFGLTVVLGSPACLGATHAEWAFEQSADISKAGLVRLTLTPETFDSALPDLSDLRLLDQAGTETAFLIERPKIGGSEVRRLENPVTALEGRTTRLTVPLQRPAQLRRVRLESAATGFLKAVSIDAVLADGTLKPLTQRQVIYRQEGVENLSLAISGLGEETRALRISADDSRTPAIPITAVVLFEEEKFATASLVSAVRIVDRVEGARETRLVVDAMGAKLPLTHVRFEIEDPLFIRRVKLLTREWEGGELRDRVLGSGSIHRISVEGAGKVEQLEAEMRVSPATRELVVSFDNGDSSPLGVRAVTLLYEPVQVTFMARQSGTYRLLSGNPEARRAQYDLASIATQLRSLPASPATAGPLTPRADYRPPQGLADVPLFGSAFEPAGWTFGRQVQIEAEGVQRLELPLHALAHTRADRADVRLVSGGRQVLYLLEHSGFARALNVPLTPSEVKNRPQISRWQIKLPQPHLPIRSIRVEVPTTLFDREISLFEDRIERGQESRRLELGRARWVRTPDRQGGLFEIGLSSAPTSDVVWLETDNGDNAPLEMKQAKALIPSVQLLFQSKDKGTMTLHYGNSEAQAPRYDLSLVAPRVLAARKQEARIADADPVASSFTGSKLSSSWFFYGVLGIVVAGLAFVISRLVPKSSAQV